MNRLLRILIPFTIGATLIVIFLIAIWPVALSRNNSIKVNALVTGVSQNGLKGIVLKLQGYPGIHFINRGAERGLEVSRLSEKLLNKRVTVWYTKPSALSKLSPVTNVLQLTEVKLGNEVIFSEFR